MPDPPARLSGALVDLRPISDWDIPEILIAHEDDRSLAARLGLARPPSGAELGAEVEQAAADWAAGTLKLTLVQPGSEDCCGRLVIDAIDPVAGRARVTVWVAPRLRGRGLAREARVLATDWLGRRCGVGELECAEDRPRRG